MKNGTKPYTCKVQGNLNGSIAISMDGIPSLSDKYDKHVSNDLLLAIKKDLLIDPMGTEENNYKTKLIDRVMTKLSRSMTIYRSQASNLRGVMTELKLTTTVGASINRVFDLARSIDLHRSSMDSTKEEVVSGNKEGLIELGQRVRWRAKHLGFWRELEVEITQMDPPYSFTDEMIDGDFSYMQHHHEFKSLSQHSTIMIDHFKFASPYGWIGRVFNKLYLNRYMYNLLKDRNAYIKAVAENKI